MVVAWVVSGCGGAEGVPAVGSGTDGSGGGATSTDGGVGSGESTGARRESAGGGGLDGDYLAHPDAGGIAFECSLFVDDCPRGEKCMPWANDGGGAWNSTRCAPLDPDPAPVGEPCMVEGDGLAGIDDCEAHAMCLFVDPGTHEGRCVAMCIGDLSAPTCADPGSVCSIGASALFLPCLPACQPLVQDCSGGDACYPMNDDFVCMPDASTAGTGVGSPCQRINGCPKGTACIDPDVIDGCDATGCCSSYCSLDDPAPRCLAGQACLPWYAPGEGAAGAELVGVCGVSQ